MHISYDITLISYDIGFGWLPFLWWPPSFYAHAGSEKSFLLFLLRFSLPPADYL